MKARFTMEGCVCTDPATPNEDVTTRDDGVRVWKVGAIVDHPKAWKLVKLGICDPVDDECEEWARMTPEKAARAKQAAKRVAAGIHPDDYELFDRGEIVGYNPDGSYKPGPNWPEYESGDTTEGGVFIP